MPHIVIIGGGFGGLYAARPFQRERVKVTLPIRMITNIGGRDAC